jgi:alkylation response protein AidB-like acyl-CoA dehydrogenase
MAMSGGAFLIQDQPAGEVFTPEDLTEEHHAIARTAREFFDKEVAPRVEEMQHGNFDVAVELLRKAAALGLESILTPERYGGMEMDLTSVMVVAEEFARDGSFGGWHGAHAGIGTLPTLLFGTEEQKQKYLPKLSTCEWIASYCLSEPQAGSDALAAKTRADLSPDGTHYVLNGQKMWITNGGKADFFTVFAKIGGEQFSAFLVERTFPGLSNGAEEKKMGIKGSSTTPIFFDNVPVPLENLLGEAGRGHIIAFNILNIGRLKLGGFAIGASRNILQISIKYAKDRKAFGTTISQFGMIQHKLAEMAIRIFAVESMTYRVEGLIKSHLEGFSWDEPDAARRMMKAVEEFAAECSIIKVYGSEMLDYVVDEGVQIHGGYGYHQDYAVERAYRDSRINRIFEGSNEINRLVITGMLLKRAQRGQLALVQAAKALMGEVLSGPTPNVGLVGSAKKIALFLLAIAFEKFGAAIEKQQEVMAAIADIVMETFAMESVQLRAQKNSIGADVAAVMLPDAMGRIEVAARPVIAACSEGDAMRANMAILRRFAKFEPVDSIGIRRRIAERLISAGRYVV